MLTRRQENFTNARSAAFERVARWTQDIDALPAFDDLLQRCLTEVQKCKQPLSMAERDKIAAQIAQSISTHFDTSKRRAPPKTSRTDRFDRNLEIINAYLSERGDGNTSTYREVASQFGVSANSVKRIVRQHLGPTEKQWQRSKNLPDPARVVVRYLDSYLPDEGMHFVSTDDFSEAIRTAMGLDTYGKDRDYIIDIAAVAEEIRDHSLALQIWPLDRGIAISRGRKITESEAIDWATKRRRLSHQQLPQHALSKRSLVFSDLGTVFRVSFQGHYAQDLKEFVLNTMIPRSALDKLIERRSILDEDLVHRLRSLTAFDIEGAARSIRLAQNGLIGGDLDKAFDVAAKTNGRDREAIWSLGQLLPLLENCESGLVAVEGWIEYTGYMERIQQNQLPGRKTADVRHFLLQLDQFTDDYQRGLVADRDIMGSLCRISYALD